MAAAIIQNKLLKIVPHCSPLFGSFDVSYIMSYQSEAIHPREATRLMKETLKSYAFPPLLLSSLQMVLKVILKIACKATKPSKYLNNTMQFIYFFYIVF